MTLTVGTRLGPYEILSALSAGGMGEVYRARDTKLDREVAIKVLPDLFVSDPERVARFQREAKTLAALNHPHIAQIYGLEGRDGQAATAIIVMELVDGADLAQRIAHGAIPIDEALPIAKQIAEALEAAHEAGIIHRDLKPANIKLRPDGTVKVLDLGLAKALEPAVASSPNVTASPTITTRAMMTGIGIILGTAAYMSPEQAKGRPADKRFARRPSWPTSAAAAVGLTIVAATLGAIVAWNARPRPVPSIPSRFVVALKDEGEFSNAGDQVIAVSPDGSKIAYSAQGRLYLRSMSDLEPEVIRGTDVNPRRPMFSPDGLALAYFSPEERALKRIATAGGVPVTVTTLDLERVGRATGVRSAFSEGSGSVPGVEGRWRATVVAW